MRVATLPLVLIVLFTAVGAYAVDSANLRYVRPGATGTGSGLDWTNAYPQIPAALTRGYVYYLADGTYGTYACNDAVSGALTITLRKAVAADHGTDVGWNAAYGDGQALFEEVDFTTSYWFLDGQTGGGPGAWKTGHGIKVSTGPAGPGITTGTSASWITIRHVEVVGNGGDGDGTTWPNNDAFYLAGSNITIGQCYVHDAGACLFMASSTNTTIEYCFGGRFESTSGQHAEIASIWNWSGVLPTNWIVRHSVWSHLEGTGGFIMEGDGLQVYGNVFYRPTGESFNAANGAVGTWSASKLTNLKISNNSFIDIASMPAIGLLNSDDTGVAENNIFYKCSVGATGNLTMRNNDIATSDPFVAVQSLDFRLKAPTAAGSALAAPFNVDPLGILRGADNVWDRGAYEFSSGPVTADTQAPTTPANLTASAASTTQVNLAWSPSTDNVGVTGYRVARNGNVIATTSSASYQDANVAPSTAYAYSVSAFDAAGNASAMSSSANVTTPAATVPSSAKSLFTTQTPALLHNTDGAGVNYELGMRFTSTAAGQITAVRFWKDSSETGTHTGRIWSAGGTLLASVVFSGETASGWQRQALASPLAITANTEYLVSVNTGNTYYVATNNGLASAVSNGSLKSIVGSNGRYGAPGKYPTQSWQASNYFRDVEFTASVVAPSTTAAYSGTPMAIPGTIVVAKYDRGGKGSAYHDNTVQNFMSSTWRPGEGVDVGNAPGDGMGWIQAGEWVAYTVNVSSAGTYTLSLPVCHPGTGGTFHIEFGGVNKTGVISVPNTGSWEVDRTVSKSVNLSAGTQVMKIIFDTNGSSGFVCGTGDVTLASMPTGTG